MNRLGKAPATAPASWSDTLRLLAVMVAFLLILLAGSWGGSTAFLSKTSYSTAGQIFSESLRHTAMAPAGRISMSAARPFAKKFGAKGPDLALPTSASAFTAGAKPDGLRPQGQVSPRREPAHHDHLARAPPSLV